MEFLLLAVYVIVLVFFWLLVFRLVVATLRLDPYNPSVQFLYRITEPLVRPFRQLRRRPSRVDPAIFPPLLILLLLVLILGNQIWWGG